MTKDEFWQAFAVQAKERPTAGYADCFHFELTEKLANQLLGLVLSGQKRATASSLYAYTLSGGLSPVKLPQVGDYSIVTDWKGAPHCVIQTKAVIIIPFCQMTFDICRREGEDESLSSWQEGHRRFFRDEGRELGYTFSEEMPVVFEDFEVVFTRSPEES